MSEKNHLSTELEAAKIAYLEVLENSRFQAGFLGKISHEIRSPLSSLMGLHQLIINDLCDSPQEQQEFIQQAYEYAKKLMVIIDRLVELSKLEIGRIDLENEQFDLKELLEDIYPIISLEAVNKNLKISLQKEINNAPIKTDKNWLTNVILFLLEIIIDLTQIGIIIVNLSANQDNKQYIIKINFDCEHWHLNEPEYQIDWQTLSLSELKQLHQTPQLSNSMKKTIIEAFLTMIGGELQIQKLSSEENKTMELRLLLPFGDG